jgi:hypothetical protein
MADLERARLINERRGRLVRQIAQLQGQLRATDADLRALETPGQLDSLIAERERVRPLRGAGNGIRGDADTGPLLDRLVAERDQRDHHRRTG